jgi:hypothetical protein
LLINATKNGSQYLYASVYFIADVFINILQAPEMPFLYRFLIVGYINKEIVSTHYEYDKEGDKRVNMGFNR